MNGKFQPRDLVYNRNTTEGAIRKVYETHGATMCLEPLRPRVRDGLPPYDDLPPALTEISPLLIVAGQRHRTKRIQV
jgi:hypothetical protein